MIETRDFIGKIRGFLTYAYTMRNFARMEQSLGV